MKYLLIAPLLAAMSMPIPALAQSKADAAFDDTMRSWLLENPDAIVDALQAYEANQRAEAVAQMDAAIARNHAALYEDGFSPILGNADGSLGIVMFADYNCPHCRRAHEALEEVLAQEPELKVVVKEWPILSQSSVLAARYAMAVFDLSGPAAYADLHHRLFSVEGQVTAEWISKDMAMQGFDADAVAAVMGGAEMDRRLAETTQLAADVGATGTPFFAFGDRAVPGGIEAETMRGILAEMAR